MLRRGEKIPDLQLVGSRGEVLRSLWARCPRVRWVHSRSAGLDGVLFPEMIDSPVPMTNGSGVFSQPLGEFFIGAALFFAKDFPRMLRSQQAGVWDPFDIVEISGQTVGIVGYGDIGRACAVRARAMGMKVLAVKSGMVRCSTTSIRWWTKFTGQRG